MECHWTVTTCSTDDRGDLRPVEGRTVVRVSEVAEAPDPAPVGVAEAGRPAWGDRLARAHGGEAIPCTNTLAKSCGWWMVIL